MDRFVKIFLVLLSSCLLVCAILSLSWRFHHDTPIMLYIAWAMDHFGSVPYRDIFDMNMPGAYAAYYLIGKLSGYSDLGIRCADLLVLTIILTINWLWMKKISNRVAWAASILWGLTYIGLGVRVSLQREFLVLLPVISAISISSSRSMTRFARNLIVGVCFGFAATIKPHALIGMFPIICFDFLDVARASGNRYSKARLLFGHIVLPLAAGVALPCMIMFAYLWNTGALNEFLDIATQYWPLYTHLNGVHTVLSDSSRIWDILRNYRMFGDFSMWLAPAAIGSYVALYNSSLKREQKRQVLLLIGLTVSYNIYPIFAGQFWTYHWLLFLFFIIQVSSLCFVQGDSTVGFGRRLYPIAVLLVVLFQTTSITIYKDTLTAPFPSPQRIGRVDDIAAFLKPRLHAGDLVQPLDWTGGAVHAMLLLKARIATPFIYDFHFYHHISSGYIQNLRKRFIAAMNTSRPRFVIDIFGGCKPWVNGENTTRNFPELETLLKERYTVACKGDEFFIYELRQERE